MNRTYLITALLVAGLFSIGFQRQNRSRLLFDGRTFAGWEGDTAQTWQVRDRALVGGSRERLVPHNEFLCTTRSYANFDLKLQFRLIGTGFVNAGVQFRSQRATKPAYEMVGYQADLGKGYWASLYDESRRDKTLAQADSALIRRILRPNDWNDYRIRCEGRRIQIYLNGKQTVDYTEPDLSIPQSGLIGLQIHGGGKAEAAYRAIELTELK
ncbi:DUF1080 domain-containing protein [Fibrella sp. HMF5335]|uniref:DUF1080 domain-containing protein n=1 Tax=Fibrella rubiginis TaxID=2817060 RepID=A0A939GMN8_9BACT|nr:DUF1080 domain-containing protein [Fibrella rubiginis]MBO0939630.1 DUF1080 domain-containing protein [Fibrella rubiginis]